MRVFFGIRDSGIGDWKLKLKTMIKTLEDFKAYNLAMDLGEEAWATVVRWGRFEQDAVGKQFVRAVDSIAANLSEGLGQSAGSKNRTAPWI